MLALLKDKNGKVLGKRMQQKTVPDAMIISVLGGLFTKEQNWRSFGFIHYGAEKGLNMSDQQQFILAPRDPAAHPRTMPSGPSGLFVTGICWECGNKLRFLECYFAPSVTLNALYVLR